MYHQKDSFNKKSTDMPAVAMYIWRFPPFTGGAEQQCKRLSESLAEKGVSVFIVTERVKDTKSFEVVNGVPVYRVNSLALIRRLPDYLKKFLWRAGKRERCFGFSENTIKKSWILKPIAVFLTHSLPNCYFFIASFWLLYKKRKDFDILHVHEAHWIALCGVRIASILNKKIIIKEAISGSLMTFNTLSLESREKVKKADLFIAISNQISKDLISFGISREKVKMIPNGVNIDAEKWNYDASGEKTAVCVSKLNQLPHKGLDILLEAWKILIHRANKNIRLLILGKGDPVLYKELAAKLGVDNLVSFPGFKENVKQYLLSSYLFILPSREEGLSNALLEAMSLGLPCIATDISGNQDLITDNINGRLIPAEDPNALADSIAFMLDNPERAVLMGANARQRIEAKYSISLIADSYIKLYENLAGTKKG